jgi:hypothetical protein
MAAQFPGDVLDQPDDAASDSGVLDARERLGQGQAVGAGEKVGDVGRRARLPVSGDSLAFATKLASQMELRR